MLPFLGCLELRQGESDDNDELYVVTWHYSRPKIFILNELKAP